MLVKIIGVATALRDCVRSSLGSDLFWGLCIAVCSSRHYRVGAIVIPIVQMRKLRRGKAMRPRGGRAGPRSQALLSLKLRLCGSVPPRPWAYFTSSGERRDPQHWTLPLTPPTLSLRFHLMECLHRPHFPGLLGRWNVAMFCGSILKSRY